MCQGLLFLALSSSSGMANEPKFQRVQTQFIAAAIDPVHGEGMKASSGTGAGDWGIWRVDPGPRGVQLREFDRLQSTGGVAPRGWKFDQVPVTPHTTPQSGAKLKRAACLFVQSDWWLEEHGLIMEKPSFPLPPGNTARPLGHSQEQEPKPKSKPMNPIATDPGPNLIRQVPRHWWARGDDDAHGPRRWEMGAGGRRHPLRRDASPVSRRSVHNRRRKRPSS